MPLPQNLDPDSGSHPTAKHDNVRPHPRLPRQPIQRKTGGASGEDAAHIYPLQKRQPHHRPPQQPTAPKRLQRKPSNLRRKRILQRRQTRLLQRPLPHVKHHRRHPNR